MSMTQGLYELLDLSSDWTIERCPGGWAVADAGSFFIPAKFPSREAAMEFCIAERIMGAVTDPEIWK